MKLCIAIAKAEKWDLKTEQHRPTDKRKQYWVRPRDDYPVLEKNLVEHFFAPAETVRMFVEVIKYYDESVDFSSNSMAGLVLTCERFKNPSSMFHLEEEDTPIAVTEERVMLAIAEAYKTMLEEKA